MAREGLYYVCLTCRRYHHKAGPFYIKPLPGGNKLPLISRVRSMLANMMIWGEPYFERTFKQRCDCYQFFLKWRREHSDHNVRLFQFSLPKEYAEYERCFESKQ